MGHLLLRIGAKFFNMNNITAEERFEWYFIRLDENQCWKWIGGKNIKNGYGRFHIGMINGKPIRKQAHIFAWESFNKTEVPSNLFILHKRDNKSCVNPHHLFLGTKQDNSLDMCNKHRHRANKITHCPNGHKYTEENTWYRPGTKRRRCKQCVSIINSTEEMKKYKR